ncbi:MAG: hypothetical protein KF729_08580 [Sandaracinaceae bacterium]|nr:hypothetical protein [Sandaracinaceae bacterium]
MQRAPAAGLVERAVVEAIDALASEKVRNAVLELALRWSRNSTIPERGPDVADFVEGALFVATEQVLGLAAAEALAAQLAPIAAMVRSQEISSVRPTPDVGVARDSFPELSISSPIAPTSRPPAGGRLVTDPAPERVPFVAVASSDPGGLDEMSRALGGVATVHAVRDALAILDELDDRETDLVVIDCRRPVVSVETLLALGPELPGDARIVLWGERADLEASLAQLGIALPDNWICCGPHASAEDVGAVCRVLLD